MWNNQIELMFIEQFQAEPTLWDTKHRDYKDKTLNNDAWNRLAELMGKSVQELKKKKESLFASYRKYRKMIRDSTRLGDGQNKVYKPVWFAYDALDSFLSDRLTPTTTINTKSNTEPGPPEEKTINKTVKAKTRNATKPRPRSLQCESGKHLKAAVSLLQSIKKRESQPSQDDCELYALGLAKKLRAFSEEERLEIMYDIDGMILNRRRTKHPDRFTTTFIPPSQCSSPMSYSESLSEDQKKPEMKHEYHE